MNEQTTPVTPTAPKTTSKKSVKNVPAKKPAALPTVATPAAKASTNGGLRKPQLRILKALAKASRPLARADLAAKAEVDIAGCVEWIGSSDADRRAANDAKHFPSLITLDMIKVRVEDHDGRDVATYEITAKGRSAAAKA